MIIGLCGFKGSGKSEAAKYIAENYKFKRVNFKDALVEEVKERFPDLVLAIIHTMDKVAYDGTNAWTFESLVQKKPALMRALLQNYGTEVRRTDDKDYWVKQWIHKVKETKGNIVTDDVRFYNELSALTEENGVLIRIINTDVTSGGSHSSEKEQEKFIEDFTVTATSGDIASIHSQIDSIINHIKAD